MWVSVSQFGIRSLLIGTNVTTTSTTYNTYNGRKFSDYDLIVVELMDDATASSLVTRATMTIPANFTGTKRINGIHGNSTGLLKDYQVTTLLMSKASDTSVNLYLEGAAALHGVSIAGLRVRQ